MKQFLGAKNLANIGWRLVFWTAVVSLVLGTAAALVGGPLTVLGNGFGGLYGLPDLFFLIALLLGVPGLIRGIIGSIKRNAKAARWILVFLGPLIISFGYVLIAHSLDPCDNGIWDLTTRLPGTIPACERFGSEINVHTRFHLFWHILPTLPLVWIYWKVLQRRLPEVLTRAK